MKKSRAICWALVMLVCAPQAFAHRSGCHRWHTCPSDRGTYSFPATGNVATVQVSSVSSSPKTSRRYELSDRVIGVADGDTITVLVGRIGERLREPLHDRVERLDLSSFSDKLLVSSG